MVLNIIDNKLNLENKLTTNDINRFHIIRQITEGKGQIICRFRNWKVKNLVYQNKKSLKTNSAKTFITEDLTRFRQGIIKTLYAKKRADQI